MAMHDVDRGNAGLEQIDRVLPEPLDLHPEALAVGHDEAEVADLRDIDPRVVDLVQNAAADREPQARTIRRAAHHLLVARAPGRLQAGAARRRAAARSAQAGSA